jgi:hypothetical protein
MGFGHAKPDVYRTSIAYVGWAYRVCETLKDHPNAKDPLLRVRKRSLAGPHRCGADETRENEATPCVRTNHKTQSESIPIPIPTPTPMGTRSRRIVNNWLQAAAKPRGDARF